MGSKRRKYCLPEVVRACKSEWADPDVRNQIRAAWRGEDLTFLLRVTAGNYLTCVLDLSSHVSVQRCRLKVKTVISDTQHQPACPSFVSCILPVFEFRISP